METFIVYKEQKCFWLSLRTTITDYCCIQERKPMNKLKQTINKLKTRWEIHSTRQVIVILIVFACTGFSVLYAEKLIFDLFDIPEARQWYISILLFLVITLPLYNLLLLMYGFIFGQFRFFWNFEKRFFSRIFGIGKRG